VVRGGLRWAAHDASGLPEWRKGAAVVFGAWGVHRKEKGWK
jgi:hypothetical protein